MSGLPLKIFMAINVLVIRISRGRLGSRLGKQTILLLKTIGRKSGRAFVTPIAYFFTDGLYFLVGSNWGKPQQAAWYYNLLAHPRTIIVVRGKNIKVEARPAEGEQYKLLWQYAIEHHPPYLHYKEMTTRHIPIMVLQPELIS
jgi:deazaflavin-dependent oxidoreductase (nitroreductase family)